MNTFKMNGVYKLVSFVLIAVLLICLVGFAANGWQLNTNDNEPDSGDVGGATDNTDENTDGNNSETPKDDPTIDNPDTQIPEEPIAPKYISNITGLEITEEEAKATPFGFVINSSSPLYGISGADLTFEFPIENGTTRLLSYTTKSSSLWKIGALAPTRDYITGMANFFGGVVVSHGSDDILKYSALDAQKLNLDLTSYQDAYFRENGLYLYTSSDLVKNAYQKNSSLYASVYKSAPFNFADESVAGTTVANTVILPYTAESETELYYSEKSGKYLLFKSGNRKVDMLTGENIAFTNVFVLFADATTYEKSQGTELVIDTLSGGNGYYISGGYRTEFRWNVNSDGELEFKTLSGERLTVNKGNSYIGFFKSSNASKVTTA